MKNKEKKCKPCEGERAKVLFVASKFPTYDEAFILRELYALSRETDITIFTIKKSRDKVVHDQARELLGRTVFVRFCSPEVIFAAIKLFVTRPLKTLGTLAELVRGNLGNSEFLAKNLVLFPKTLYLADFALRNKVTHVHGNWATYPASMAMAVSRITGIPFSFTGHAHDIYLNTTHLREKIAAAVFVGTCTVSNKSYLLKAAEEGTDPDKVLINHHGLDLSLFDPGEKKRNPCFQILSVGTLQYYKGFDHLLNALAILKDKQLNFHCTIIGGGPLESDLRKHIEMLGLRAHVTMTGALKQTQVIPFYKSSDVSVLMAQSEWHWGIPNVIIESLAAKTAVITTHFGSVEELIREGETGFFVPSKDPGKLAEAFERLYHDDALRTRTAEAGCKAVHVDFDLGKNIKEFRRRLTGEALPAKPARRKPSVLLAKGVHFLKGRAAPQGARILCYHRVREGASDYLSVTPGRFREQMRYLKAKDFRVVSLEEALSVKADGKAVAVTFDDGWRDNFDHAFPVLKECGFNAAVFCIAGRVGRPDYLSTAQIHEMRRQGIEFGSHTVSHPELNTLNWEEKKREILGSKKMLEETAGGPVRFFCYPYGIYDDETVRIVEDAGYLGACSTRPGMNRYVQKNGMWAVEDPFRLRRTEIGGEDTPEVFALKLAGAYDELHFLLHAVRGRP
jgi:glycosyltransferase involved in cell wall biosynthesis/peptidoglycan/xylan/chitin deacetylase (PgdA/CDA1 family)